MNKTKITQMKKLSRLIDEARSVEASGIHAIVTNECIAEYLIESGIFVPPCDIGDSVYVIIESPESYIDKKVVESIVLGAADDKITFTDGTSLTIWFKDWRIYHKNVFPSEDEAKYAIKNRRSVSLINGHIEE